jgi:hypothetical protein
MCSSDFIPLLLELISRLLHRIRIACIMVK